MTAAWEPESLWIKAKLFVNHAMDESPDRAFEERALWATLGLELLAKCALARVSPLLIATPTEDGAALLAATGLISAEVEFTSAPAKTVFSRCARAFPPFNLSEALALTRSRNSYLHSGTPSFSPLPPEAWWPRYWSQASLLVSACGRDLESFVGYRRVDEVEAQLGKAKLAIEHRVEILMTSARQGLSRYTAGQMQQADARRWEQRGNLRAGFSHSEPEECPACQASGLLEGDSVLSTETQVERLGEDEFDVWVDVEVASDHFSCPNCHLVLNSPELVTCAGLPDTFFTHGDLEDFPEPEYGND